MALLITVGPFLHTKLAASTLSDGFGAQRAAESERSAHAMHGPVLPFATAALPFSVVALVAIASSAVGFLVGKRFACGYKVAAPWLQEPLLEGRRQQVE